MSYRNLQIWELSRKSAIDIHRMTMKLPTFEFYETGSPGNTLPVSIFENEKKYKELKNTVVLLGKKINLFLQTLDQSINK